MSLFPPAVFNEAGEVETQLVWFRQWRPVNWIDHTWPPGLQGKAWKHLNHFNKLAINSSKTFFHIVMKRCGTKERQFVEPGCKSRTVEQVQRWDDLFSTSCQEVSPEATDGRRPWKTHPCFYKPVCWYFWISVENSSFGVTVSSVWNHVEMIGQPPLKDDNRKCCDRRQ